MKEVNNLFIMTTKTKLFLTSKEESELRKRKENERDGKILRRFLCLEMKNKGYSHREIAELCDVCIDTITDWLRLYKRGGLNALSVLHYDGRRPSKLDRYLEDIKRYIEKKHPSRIVDLQVHIERKWHIEVEESWLWRWCKKNSVFHGNYRAGYPETLHP